MIEKERNHDVRASLAVAAGFSQELQITFDELIDLYGILLEQTAKQESGSNAGDDTKDKVDSCRFLLSRLSHSIDQLKRGVNDL